MHKCMHVCLHQCMCACIASILVTIGCNFRQELYTCALLDHIHILDHTQVLVLGGLVILLQDNSDPTISLASYM